MDMPPHSGLGLTEAIVVSVADTINLEKIERKWWWKPLTKFLFISPFIALGIYYFS